MTPPFEVSLSAPGKILFLLHAHLPFVRHPEYKRFFEENWLFEAIAESYLPFIQAMRRLLEKGVPGKFNLSVSSPLMEMLSDNSLKEKFSLHLKKQLELIEKEVERSKDLAEESLAKFYLERQKSLIDTWENRCHRDILGEFLALERAGKLNLLTCVGTHPFLPIYQSDPTTIREQLLVTVKCFEHHFGRKPLGVWLPECGYFSGLDAYLAEFGIKYFFLETHGVLLANPPPKYGVFTPMKTLHGCYCMGREQSSSMEVWSRKTGFPGHPEYREFFRDIAKERPREYLGEYFFAGDSAIDSGFKYYRITGSENKELYRPWNAMQLARDHAKVFIAHRDATVTDLLPKMEGNGVTLLCPYDAELFGHWWFEGPYFLEALLERAASSSVIEFAGADSVMLNSCDKNLHEPAFSSWGEGGFAGVWLNNETEEYYPESYRMRIMIRTLEEKKIKLPRLRRIIKQMKRELMLFQSSDWAFMIHNHADVSYARQRLSYHYQNVCALFKLAQSKSRDLTLLSKLEKTDNVFSWM